MAILHVRPQGSPVEIIPSAYFAGAGDRRFGQRNTIVHVFHVFLEFGFRTESDVTASANSSGLIMVLTRHMNIALVCGTEKQTANVTVYGRRQLLLFLLYSSLFVLPDVSIVGRGEAEALIAERALTLGVFTRSRMARPHMPFQDARVSNTPMTNGTL